MDNSADFAMGYTMGDRNNNGYGNGWGNNSMFGMEWIFALLLLPAMFNGGGLFGNNRNGEPVTESGLCNAMNFNNLEGAVGRLGDQVNGVNTNISNAVCQLGYETLRNFNSLERQLADCCCQLGNQIQQNRYEAAMNTAAINANTTASGQKVLDAICGLRMEMKDDRNAQLLQRVNQLELQGAIDRATCGIVRYPTSTTYATNCNPFFGGYGYGYNNGCGCNAGCCGNNI